LSTFSATSLSSEMKLHILTRYVLDPVIVWYEVEASPVNTGSIYVSAEVQTCLPCVLPIARRQQ